MTAPLRGFGRLFVFGAVFGSFFDGFHTFGGATAYASPVALRMAWWTPPLFGGAFVLLGLVYAAARRDGDPAARNALAGFAAFGALYFSSGFLPASNAVKLAVLLAGAAGLFAFVDRSRAALVTALAASVAGPGFEVVLVHLGVFAHLQPDFAGVPVWLPGLYFASGPGVGPLSRLLVRGAVPAAAAAA
jgi:hypothetical protein